VNSSVFQLGGLIGPAIAGVLLVAVGAGWAFAINAVACAVTVLTLFQLSTSTLIRTAAMPRSKGQLREGLAYVRRKPVIFWSIVMVAILSVFALSMPVILSAYATEVYGVGAAGYGLFNSLVAAGALTGAILSTRRRSVRLRTVVLAGVSWGVLQAIAGLAPTQVGFAALLVALGIANLLFITAANSLVQMSSNIGIRGRVMSLYVLVLLGGQALGGPLMGWIVETNGAQFGMTLSGLVPAVAAVVIGIHLARRGHLRVRVSLQRTLPVVSIVRRIDGGIAR
jgi:MFS family permease